MGKMKGKAGNLVLATVGGEVVAREYNPNVTNPNTEGQQVTRSRFKLLSQLAATMSPVIAIRKEGLKSARNQFTSINYDKTSVNNDVASVNLNQIQLTKSNRSMVGFTATRNGSASIEVALKANAVADLSRVVYIMYEMQTDGTLRLVTSETVATAGANGTFPATFAGNAGSVVLYAYGIKDLESGITTKFGNLNAPTAEQVAKLLVSSNENMSSVQLTKTVALTMNEGTNSGDSDDNAQPAGTVTISIVNHDSNVQVTGAGEYEPGEQVTVTTSATGGAMSFNGWFETVGGQEELVSSSQSYTFTASRSRTLTPQWANQD